MSRWLIPVLFVFPLLAQAAPKDNLKKPAEWFRSDVGRERVANVISWQDANGAWPKNRDNSAEAFRGDSEKLQGTFDNRATVNELRLLARAIAATDNPAAREAFLKGLRCILETQYENGGWPQSPEPRGYAQHITFNDDTMIGLMSFLREVHEDELYGFVPADLRKQAGAAVDRGVECIVNCQVRINGRLTVWCAQHDRDSLAPAGARVYEHPSLSGFESLGIACFLMSLEEPSDEVRRAVRAAVEWFRDSQITGVRLEKVDGDLKVIRDKNAKPVWARFYELDTNRPIFSGRDGVIRYDVTEIEPERRNGYAWYGNWGEKIEACWDRCEWK
ncbi:pectate lyase [Rubinisphaera margarita]|uniref:pectate lyase n=1 Tax=Rubinisphaera margarita TaxID=2909586 RepID=UPI001EE8BF5E|nr:pectate lyase [Rubinisphaera margarita]MCG6154811.1 pectate lyase [Rubinisphaera margarita]